MKAGLAPREGRRRLGELPTGAEYTARTGGRQSVIVRTVHPPRTREMAKKKQNGLFITADSGGHAQRPFWPTSSQSLIANVILMSAGKTEQK